MHAHAQAHAHESGIGELGHKLKSHARTHARTHGDEATHKQAGATGQGSDPGHPD